MVGLQIFFAYFFSKFYLGNMYCFCNKNRKKKLLEVEHVALGLWLLQSVLFIWRGFSWEAGCPRPASQGHSQSWGPVGSTKEACVSGRHSSKLSMPTFVMCCHKALPQAMSHLPKDSPFVNESFLLKIIYLHLTLALLTLEQAQLLFNTTAFRNSTFLVPPGARNCLQFSLSSEELSIQDPLFFLMPPIAYMGIKEKFFFHDFEPPLHLKK